MTWRAAVIAVDFRQRWTTASLRCYYTRTSSTSSPTPLCRNPSDNWLKPSSSKPPPHTLSPPHSSDIIFLPRQTYRRGRDSWDDSATRERQAIPRPTTTTDVTGGERSSHNSLSLRLMCSDVISWGTCAQPLPSPSNTKSWIRMIMNEVLGG